MTTDPQPRDIYRCPVSGRFLDPFAVHRELVVRSGNGMAAIVTAYNGTDPAARADAEGRFQAVVRGALGLPGIDPETGDGYTDAEVLAAYNAYQEYLRGKAERGPSSPARPRCRVCPQG